LATVDGPIEGRWYISARQAPTHATVISMTARWVVD